MVKHEKFYYLINCTDKMFKRIFRKKTVRWRKECKIKIKIYAKILWAIKFLYLVICSRLSGSKTFEIRINILKRSQRTPFTVIVSVLIICSLLNNKSNIIYLLFTNHI